MSNKNKRYQNQRRPQNQQHDGYGFDISTIAEGIISLEDTAEVRIHRNEYRALVESDTRVKIMKAILSSHSYVPGETVPAVMGFTPKGEKNNA